MRGANRNGTLRYETATLVEHTTGVPLASLNFRDHNGELAAVGALLEVVPISGALLTLDALHTTRDTAASIVEQHGADYLLTVKKNCPKTYEALATMPWEQATGRFCEDPEKGHGRIDRRHIEVLTPPKKTIDYPHVAQVFRVRRERTDINSDAKSITYAYGITSVSSADASAQQLLAWNRGHWAIESNNHQRRDKTLDEDAWLERRLPGGIRTRWDPLGYSAFPRRTFSIRLAMERGTVRRYDAGYAGGSWMQVRSARLLQGFAAVLMAVGLLATSQPVRAQEKGAAPPGGEPRTLSLERLRNAQYRLPLLGDEEIPIRFHGEQGSIKFGEGATQRVQAGLVGDLVAHGDLDGDLVDDAAMAVFIDPGGSGTFIHLLAMTDDAGKPVQAGREFLGDRVRVQDLTVSGGRIYVTMRAHGPGDGLCCPSIENHSRVCTARAPTGAGSGPGDRVAAAGGSR